jgi:lysozyme family protein
MIIPLTDELRAEYQNLFDTCQLDPGAQGEVDLLAAKIVQNRHRYEDVGTPLSIPWYFLGVIHNMESSQRFDRHLHNGDPLTARTVHVPAGRPASGDPPFTWEASATDALQLEGLDRVTDWSFPALLYRVEKYNGFGYRNHHPEVLSPYLWSGSNHYTKGKFVADGQFDPDAVSKQRGAAVILRRMSDQNVLPPTTIAAPIT